MKIPPERFIMPSSGQVQHRFVSRVIRFTDSK